MGCFKFLEVLHIANNQLVDLKACLEVLSKFHHLKELDMHGNPVAEETNYRLRVIGSIPSLRILDRHVVKEDEKRAAQLLVRGRKRTGATQAKLKATAPPISSTNLPPPSGCAKMVFREARRLKGEDERRKEADLRALFDHGHEDLTGPGFLLPEVKLSSISAATLTILSGN